MRAAIDRGTRRARRDEVGSAHPTTTGVTARTPRPGERDGLDLVGVSRSFPTKDGPVVALDDVDLAAARGSFTALIGPSGCGKSTLLRLIGDLDAPTSGMLVVHGREPAAVRRAGALGVAFQDPALMPWRDVRRNIALPLQVMRRRVEPARIQHLVDLAAPRGSFTALIGPSGCGKSTLLRLIGDLDEHPRRRRCGAPAAWASRSRTLR